ncbi:ABC transporter substrate-binding protein [Clostridium sp.]|uniref:ABC transporter substrate-binding protein n=1 Tax=Clostridium sp. TaxID=1506 RepID=UPI003F384DDD
MRKIFKRLISATLCSTLMLSVIGCGEKSVENKMGRYLEERYTLPEGVYFQEMVKLQDGKIAMIGGGQNGELINYLSEDGGQSWTEKKIDLPKQEGKETLTAASTVLKDGQILTGYYFMDPIPENGEAVPFNKEEYKEPEIKYGIVDNEGKFNEKNIDFSQPGETEEGMGMGMPHRFKGANNGDIFYQTPSGEEVVQIDGQTFEEKNRYQSSDYIENFLILENSLIIWGFSGIVEYDIETGKEKGNLEALEKETIKTTTNYYPTVLNSDSKDKIYYYSVLGLNAYDIANKKSEQLIDGALSIFGTRDASVSGFIEKDNGDFLVLVSDWTTGETSLLNYTYSADTPAVPDKQLTVYSLVESDTIRQAVSAYSKSHQDTYVKYEIGLSYDGGATEADALKTLNTEIMAGNGPDVILLEGLPVDSYIEKGLLEDISDVIASYSSEGAILKNIEDAYKVDGKIYQFPTSFKLPMLVGEKANIEKVTDFDSYANLVKELGQASDKRIFDYYSPKTLIYSLYYLYGNTWLNDDNTINADNMKKFLNSSKEMYTVINDKNEKYMKKMEESYKEPMNSIDKGEMIDSSVSIDKAPEEEYKPSPGEEDMMNHFDLNYSLNPSLYIDSMFMDEEPVQLMFGGIDDGYSYASMVTALNSGKNIDFKVLTRGDENIFMPVEAIGVNSKSANKEAAKEFVKEILSEKVQTQGWRRGLPVNKIALQKKFELEKFEGFEPEKDEATNHYIMGSMFYTDVNGNEKEVKQLWPNEEDVNRIMGEIEKVNVAPTLNKVLLLEVAKQFETFAQGECSVDEAVNKIIENLDIYLSE